MRSFGEGRGGECEVTEKHGFNRRRIEANDDNLFMLCRQSVGLHIDIISLGLSHTAETEQENIVTICS